VLHGSLDVVQSKTNLFEFHLAIIFGLTLSKCGKRIKFNSMILTYSYYRKRDYFHNISPPNMNIIVFAKFALQTAMVYLNHSKVTFPFAVKQFVNKSIC